MSRRYLVPLTLLAMLCGWLVAGAVLTARPAVALSQATGLYGVQQGIAPYQWTSNRVQVPIGARSGPTMVRLAFGPSRWEGRPNPTITLTDDRHHLATFAAPDQLRSYRLLLAPTTSAITITTPVAQPAHDPRWLGVALYGLSATATGWPLRAVLAASLIMLALALLGAALAWSIRRGTGHLALLLLLALVTRVALLRRAPPGFRADEVVSLVDAWFLARTGRDHLGNPLPFGAQEAFGDWISPLLTYLEMPMAALFGPHLLVGRLLTACCGVLAVAAVYALARALGLPTLAAFCAGLVAALSPWQMFMSRIALPPALVPLCWSLCLLAGVWLIRRGSRREALLLALIAGVALYAYPTLKLAVPLLVGWAVALALLRHGWGVARRWWPGALLVSALWLPFGYVTLFNPASSTRLDQTLFRADSWRDWLAIWWDSYRIYFRPDFYYRSGDGSSIRGVPGHGVELSAGMPLLLLGLAALVGLGVWHAWRWLRNNHTGQPGVLALFILGAILLAPLPSSVTQPSPHNYRAATLAPLYALLVGLGAATVLRLLASVVQGFPRRLAAGLLAIAFGGALAWQAGGWFRAYVEEYPALQAWDNQDQMVETMARAIAYAPNFDEVWIIDRDVNQPYIYLLAAQPMPSAQAQALIQVQRRPGDLNTITSIGTYRFVKTASIPIQEPILEAIPDQYGGPAFLLHTWQNDGKQVLVVRRMQEDQRAVGNGQHS